MVGAPDENEAEEDRSFSPPPSSSPPPPPPSPRLQPPASPPPRPLPIPSLHTPASPPPVLDMTDVGENPRRPSNPSASKEEEEDDPRQQGGHAAAWRQAQAGLRLPVSTNITCARTLRPAAETGLDVGVQGGGGGFGGGGVARADEAEARGRGPRQPYRGGYTEGKTADEFGRPHRSYERRSGTGRGYGMKRDGASDEGLPQGNVEAVSTEDTVSVIENKVEKEGVENEEEEKEALVTEMTLEEYKKVLEEQRKALLVLKTEERKDELGKELQSIQMLSVKKDADELSIKLKEYEKVKEGAENEEEEKEAEDKDEYEKVKEAAENEEEEKHAEDNEKIEISIMENLNVEGISRNQIISNYISGKIVVKFPPEMDRSVLFMVSRWNEIGYTAYARVDRELFNKVPILTSERFPEGFDLLKWGRKNGQLPLPLIVSAEAYEDPHHKYNVKGVSMNFVVVNCRPTSMSDIRNVVVTIPFPGVDHSGNERKTRKHIWKSVGTHLELESSLEWKIPRIAATDRSAKLCVDAFCYDGWQHPSQFFPIRVQFSYDRTMGSEVAHVVRTRDGRGVDFRQNTVARCSYVVHHPNELARRAAEAADEAVAWQLDWEDEDNFV